MIGHGKYDWPGVAGPGKFISIKGQDDDLAFNIRRNAMKTWMKPSVREQEVGLEVTSYLPADIDII